MWPPKQPPEQVPPADQSRLLNLEMQVAALHDQINAAGPQAGSQQGQNAGAGGGMVCSMCGGCGGCGMVCSMCGGCGGCGMVCSMCGGSCGCCTSPPPETGVAGLVGAGLAGAGQAQGGGQAGAMANLGKY